MTNAPLVRKDGWRGRYYEDFETGDVYRHRLGRTVTETDNTLFTMLTLNTNPIHFDGRLAAKTPFGKILVNSCFTLSLAVGLSVSDLSEHVMANLGGTTSSFRAPFSSETRSMRRARSSTNASRPRDRTWGS